MRRDRRNLGAQTPFVPFFLIHFNSLFPHLPLASPEFWRNAENRIRRFKNSRHRYNNPNVFLASFPWPSTCVKLLSALNFNFLVPQPISYLTKITPKSF